MNGNSISVIDLTAAQRRFVRELALTGAPVQFVSAKIGWSEDYGYQALAKPHVLAALHDQQSKQLRILGSLAIKRLRQILEDEDLRQTEKGRRLQLDAAKTVLDRAGHIAPKARDTAGDQDKPLTEMTRDELYARLGDIEGALAQQAIDVTTSSAPDAPTLEQPANDIEAWLS